MASDRLQTFAAIESSMNTITGRIQRLAIIFKELEARTATDDGLIDELVATGAELTAAAESLKTVEYDPTPPEEDIEP